MTHQQRIDVKNLRFYAECFRQQQWEVACISWTVFEATLNEIADRIEAEGRTDV